jgi:beta-lactamase regulating signal transducer with metallopeptidase domain
LGGKHKHEILKRRQTRSLEALKTKLNMMSSITGYLNEHGESFLNFAWPMLWQSSLLMVLVGTVDVLLSRRIRASVRHALWLVVLVKLLLPPTLALPTGAAWWLFPVKPAVKAPAARNFTVTFDNATPPPAFDLETVPLDKPPPPALERAGWALLAAGTASTGLLLWLLFRWWQVMRLVRRATPAGEFSGPLDEARRLARLRRPVRVRIVDDRMSPAVCGLFRPVILLPRMLAEKLSAGQLRAVLLHEAIHLRRQDIWVNCAQALLQVIYWWHPLVWVANARIRRVREEAVDDAVMLALTDDAETYAPTLLEVARLAFRRPRMSLGLVGIMESRSALRQRIERLMDFRAPRKAGLTFLPLCGIFVFSAVAVPMGQGPSPAEAGQTIRTFGLKPHTSEAQLRKLLLDAGVKMPPTMFIYNSDGGVFLVRGTPEQLALVYCRVAGQQNGHPANDAAARRDFIASLQRESADNLGTNAATLFTRTFKLDTNLFPVRLHHAIESLRGQGLEIDDSGKTVSAAAKDFFSQLGVNWAVPAGKSVFFNDHLGLLFVKGSTSDLDTIERTLEVFNQTTPLITHKSAAAGNQTDRVQAVVSVTNQTSVNVASPEDAGGRQAIIAELNAIHLKNVSYDSLPLNEVLRQLSDQCGRLRDPEHIGINFLINNGPYPPGQPGAVPNLDPNTGLPVVPTAEAAATGQQDVGSVIIKIPSLTNVCLADVLDAIVLDSDHPLKYSVQDFAVVFSARSPESPLLFTRTFRVDTNAFYSKLKKLSAKNSGAVQSDGGDQHNASDLYLITSQTAQATPSSQARAFCKALGVNLDNPPGKSVFFNDRLGYLFVKATASDLYTIERALQVLNAVPPQFHIKARFYEAPKGTLSGLDKLFYTTNATDGTRMGILSWKKTVEALRELQSLKGSEILGEPEVTVITGRQVQMRATEVITVITNYSYAANGSIIPQTCMVEVGPSLDAVPYELADGYTINLTAIPSLTEFLGYNSTQGSADLTKLGNQVPQVFPKFHVQQTVSTVNLWDNQTLLLGGLPDRSVGGTNGVSTAPSDKELLVLITVTLVDAAGARIHSEDELPFAQEGIPSQPPSSKK